MVAEDHRFEDRITFDMLQQVQIPHFRIFDTCITLRCIAEASKRCVGLPLPNTMSIYCLLNARPIGGTRSTSIIVRKKCQLGVIWWEQLCYLIYDLTEVVAKYVLYFINSTAKLFLTDDRTKTAVPTTAEVVDEKTNGDADQTANDCCSHGHQPVRQMLVVPPRHVTVISCIIHGITT